MDVWTENYCHEENKLLTYNVASLFIVFEKVRSICGFRFILLYSLIVYKGLTYKLFH